MQLRPNLLTDLLPFSSSPLPSHARDQTTMQLRPNLFTDLAEHLVAQSVPLAAAQATNMMGETDPVRGGCTWWPSRCRWQPHRPPI